MKQVRNIIVWIMINCFFINSINASFLLLSDCRMSSVDIGYRLSLPQETQQKLELIEIDCIIRQRYINSAQNNIDPKVCKLVAINQEILRLNHHRHYKILYEQKETFEDAKNTWKIMALESKIKKIIEQK